MAWRLFQWGSRGLYYDTGRGVYVAHIFISNCVQVSLFGEDERHDELLHVFHCGTIDLLPTQHDCDHIAAAVDNWARDPTTGFHTLLNSGVIIRRVVAQSIAEFEGPFAELSIGVSGTRTGDRAPSLLTLNLKKSTDLAGRSHRGYFATWPMVLTDVSLVDPNIWDGAYVTECETRYNELRTNLASASLPMVLASRARQNVTGVTNILAVNGLVRNRHSRAAEIGR